MTGSIKAVILVGGEGTRLRPLTYSVPKAMVPVLNKPFLEHMFDSLKSFGISDIILALCYYPDHIRSYFKDGKDFGINLTYVVESSPLGTAGAVKNVADYLDNTFVVLNGDVFTDLNISAMLNVHRKNKAKVSIALTAVDNPSAYGVVVLDNTSKAKQFIEKPQGHSPSNLINAGTYIIEPEVLNLIPQGKKSMFEYDLFPLLLNMDEPVYGYASSGYWIDIGTPEKYTRLNFDLLQGKARGLKTLSVENKINSIQDPTVKINGPVYVGKNCLIESGVILNGPVVIGSDCKIAVGSYIEQSILWQGVLSGEHSILRNCIIGNDCRIGEGTCITGGPVIGENCIIGNNCTIDGLINYDPGFVMKAGTVNIKPGAEK